MVLMETELSGAPALMNKAVAAIEAGLTPLQQLRLFQRFVRPSTDLEDDARRSVWPPPALPSKIVGIITHTAALTGYVNLDRHSEDFVALFGAAIKDSECATLHLHDNHQQTLYVLWPRGDVDTGYGHIVVRAGKGPTARALDDHFRALTTQKADTEEFIKAAAGRSDHAGQLITHLEEGDHEVEEEEEADDDRQEEQEEAQPGADGRAEGAQGS